MLQLRGEGHKEPPVLSHAIPQGSDCGHGHGGAVLMTPPSSTPRTAGAGGEQRDPGCAGEWGWSVTLLLSDTFVPLVFCCNLICSSCRSK